MGKKSTRTLLKEANQAARDAKNEAHQLGVKAAYQARLIETISLDTIELQRMRAAARARLSDVEIYALAAVVHTESSVGTPERKLLVEQLKLRGVIGTADNGGRCVVDALPPNMADLPLERS